MLSFHDVVFHYPGQPLFNNLSFSVESGEFVFLIGKSGAGKSTLLQMIYMNLLPQSGVVYAAGYDSSRIRTKELPFLRRKIGIVFQDFKLLSDRNVYDNLAFVLEATGCRKPDFKRKIFNALSEVGLQHKRTNMPYELSGGEQQRVSIARAIINEPSLILADEPTGNLDPETSDEILSIIQRINSKGASVLFATHNYDIVRKINAKILKLENGKAIKGLLKEKK